MILATANSIIPGIVVVVVIGVVGIGVVSRCSKYIFYKNLYLVADYR